MVRKMIRHKTRIPHAFTLTREIPHTYTTHYMYNPFTWTDFIKSRNAVHLYIFQKELPTIIPSNINTDRNQKITQNKVVARKNQHGEFTR